MHIFVLILMLILSGCDKANDYIVSATPLIAGSTYASVIAEDNSLAIISSVDAGVIVWDTTKKLAKFELRHGAEDVNTVMNLSISANNSHALTADRETFALWDLSSGEPIGFWRIDESSIRDTAIASNGKAILVGRGNGKVLFFEPNTGRRLEFFGHTEKINSVDLSPNGRYALTGGNDYSALLWDTKSGQVVYRFPHDSRVSKVRLDPQGRYAFTADSQQTARIWDLKSGEEVTALQYSERQKIFTTVRFSEDGKQLLTGAPSRKVTVWNIADGEPITRWLVTANPYTKYASAIVHDVNFKADGNVLTASSSGMLETWNIGNSGE